MMSQHVRSPLFSSRPWELALNGVVFLLVGEIFLLTMERINYPSILGAGGFFMAGVILTGCAIHRKLKDKGKKVNYKEANVKLGALRRELDERNFRGIVGILKNHINVAEACFNLETGLSRFDSLDEAKQGLKYLSSGEQVLGVFALSLFLNDGELWDALCFLGDEEKDALVSVIQDFNGKDR